MFEHFSKVIEKIGSITNIVIFIFAAVLIFSTIDFYSSINPKPSSFADQGRKTLYIVKQRSGANPTPKPVTIIANPVSKNTTTGRFAVSAPSSSKNGLGIIAPQIFNLNLKNNSIVGNSVVSLQGMITDNVSSSNQIDFTINGKKVALSQDGSFRTDLQLQPGNNVFTLFAKGPPNNPAQQINDITSYLDGSAIYGSDQNRENALRTFSDGLMKTSPGNNLPLNTANLLVENDTEMLPNTELFLAGDIRDNENIEITAIQVLMLREHNLIARLIKKEHPQLSDEQIFQWARRVVIAEMQEITYNEYLPSLLGPNAQLQPYNGYNADTNAGVANEFANAAFRGVGHPLVNNEVEFLNSNGKQIAPVVDLQNAFDNPGVIEKYGADPILKFLSTGNSQEVNTGMSSGIRNFLFGEPGQGGFDLESLDVQRGRDHGLADYNATRKAFGLAPVTSFSQITSNSALASKLKSLYGSVNDIDLLIGGESENHLPDGSVGPLFSTILVNQFERIRDGDRFWYQRTFSGKALTALQSTTLADIIARNTSITKLQNNVFFYNPKAKGDQNSSHSVSRTASMDRLLQIINNTSPVGPFGIEPVNGYGNNVTHPTWGEAGTDFLRLASPDYADGVNQPAGADRPSARLVSNTVANRNGTVNNNRDMSAWAYAWGQFVDHDLDFTDAGTVPFNVDVPRGDPQFDPQGTGTQQIMLERSSVDQSSGTGVTQTSAENYYLVFSPDLVKQQNVKGSGLSPYIAFVIIVCIAIFIILIGIKKRFLLLKFINRYRKPRENDK